MQDKTGLMSGLTGLSGMGGSPFKSGLLSRKEEHYDDYDSEVQKEIHEAELAAERGENKPYDVGPAESSSDGDYDADVLREIQEAEEAAERGEKKPY